MIDEDKEKLKRSIPLIRAFLKDTLHLQLHPRKIYLQHYSRGVAFLGAFIKPYHTIVGRRSLSSFSTCIESYRRWPKGRPVTEEDKKRFLCCVNSHLGLMAQHKSFRARKKRIKALLPPFSAIAVWDIAFTRASLSSKRSETSQVVF